MRKVIRSASAFILVGVLVPAQVLAAVPAPPAAQPQPEDEQPTVNRTVPAVTPIVLRPTFSASPSEAEISQARIFGEPLVPSGATVAAENAALAAALTAYLDETSREHVQPLMQYLHDHPNSPWRLSLLANIATVLRRTGHYSRALATAEEVWQAGKSAQGPRIEAMVNDALGNVAELYSRLGRADQLQALLAEVEGRPLHGSVTERLSGAKQALWLMNNKPEESFRCGPLALKSILLSRTPNVSAAAMDAARSTPQGTSLAEMAELATKAGLGMQMAFRSALTTVMTPAMIHWRAGHYAAIVREDDGRYLVQDPTFGEEVWVSREAIEEESSGYFLIPQGTLAPGWRSVDQAEGGQVWGKGVPMGQNNRSTSKKSNKTGGNRGKGKGRRGKGSKGKGGKSGGGGSGGGSSGNGGPQGSGSGNGPGENCGMAGYSFHTLLANLTISDTPVGYTPPVGPAVQFEATYNYRDAFQPAIFTFSNLGSKWTFDWISYVTDDPGLIGQSPTVYLRGAGSETYTGYNPTTQSYAPDFMSRAVLVRTSGSPIRYERLLPDGSKEVFAQPDGAVTSPRRVFLTEIHDASGNRLSLTYDASLRLVAIRDAVGIGQVTTLSYDLPSDPLKITKVTDPFGRFATFEYNASGQLIRITDVVGITSEFAYSGGDFISSLTTPYGTTQFAFGETGAERWVEAIDPLGGRERLQYQNAHSPVLPGSDPIAVVPAGFAAWNSSLNSGVSLFWDKQAMSVKPGDPAAATVYNWMWEGSLATDVIRTLKEPLENRVWFAYPGQGDPRGIGSGSDPSAEARVLDDGTTQTYSYEYNASGMTIKETDPVGRETVYVYGTGSTPDAIQSTGSGIDLLQIKQKNGASYDVLASYTYNAQHLPLTYADAAGKVTTYTYNARGQLLTVVTPARAGITENRTTTLAYDTNGYLQNVTGPATGATAGLTYDGYGRVRTLTDSEGYVLTVDYDALDRLKKVTYPDTTYEEVVYNKLDAEKTRDRLGRWTYTFHDALGRPVSTRDPAGRTTTVQWCSCGSMDKLVDANGNATTWQRDLQKRVTKEIRADNSAREFTYEATTSRLKKLKDAKGQEIQYSYLLDDRLQQVSYPTAQIATPTVSFTYDSAFPRLAAMVDGTGSTTFIYHPIGATPPLGAGRLASVDGPYLNDTISYGYDELGRVVSRTLNSVTSSWSYDVLGRLASQSDPIGTFTYAYVGTTGRPQSLTYPNGQVSSYTYFPNTGDQRLQEIHHRTAAAGSTLSRFTYAYDAVGNIKTWTQQYAATSNAYDLGYDPGDQLTAATYRTTDPTPAVLKRYAYGYDPAGNRTTEQIDNAPVASVYNSLNRLVSQDGGGALTFKGMVSEPAAVTLQGKPAVVTPDSRFAGSAQVTPGTNTVAVVATDPSGNASTKNYQVSVSAGPKTLSYDGNGSLTSNGTKTYEWDGQNRLVRILETASEVARFSYDGFGRRAQKVSAGTTRTYVYGGEDILEERLSTGGTIRYVHGPGIDNPLASIDGAGAVSYYLADHLGNVMQTTNSAAAVTLTRQYDMYGNLVAGGTMSGYAFTGREWDAETGLYYYRSRYYDPVLGRFLSEDPAKLAAGLNFYRYVANNPLKWLDPYGLEESRAGRWLQSAWEWTKEVATAVATALSYIPEEVAGSVPGQAGTPVRDAGAPIIETGIIALKAEQAALEAMETLKKKKEQREEFCAAFGDQNPSACPPAPGPKCER